MNKPLIFAVLIAGVAITTGCTNTSSNQSVGTQKNNTTGKETYVVWKQVQNPAPDQDNVNKEIFEANVPQSEFEKISLLFDQLKKQQEGSNLLPTIPADVQLLHVAIKDQELVLDFNDRATKMEAATEGVFVKSINYTMMHNFTKDPQKEINNITYQINGKTVKTLGQNELSCNRGETCWETFLSKAAKK